MKGLILASSTALTLSLAVTLPSEFENSSSNTHILASQIYSAAFNDVSPGFDDLYVIKTQDKGREIVIYCNTTYCYKNRNRFMTG